ncbi:unnamed protein product [Effrenium voratum]|uniref:Endonuclease/exonuclease/phosphatase domain-containing protein n=1 Tax=Effrenium voratum TaxID=2562239 RepID=A0AA36NJF7_9DINO|nr:unnamed protein product [Effrenium voratum]CAJ1447171.1 unnamed protein product [Effrenium voratum]
MDTRRLAALGLPLVGGFLKAHLPPTAALPPAPAPAPTLPPELERGSAAHGLAEAMRRPLPSSGEELSVVSFNMLLKGFDQKPYYPSVPSSLRAWPLRKLQLQRLISGIGADVFCMQEVECRTFEEEFCEFLAGASYGAVAPRDDSQGKIPELAKCAIFFKSSKLELLWTDHRSRAVLCALRHLPSHQVVYVASCHLEGHPGEGATRLTQLRKALQSIRRHQQQSGFLDSALIFAGDFNEDETGAVCQSLKRPEDAEGFRLSDLYASHGKRGLRGARPPTFAAPGSELRAIDFVFYSEHLVPRAIRAPFTAEQLAAAAKDAIPADWHFSDHVPLGATFAWRNEETASGAESAVVV